MSTKAATWKAWQERISRLETLSEIRGLLEWDQYTFMPDLAAEGRGRQAALLASLEHEWITDPALGEILEELDASSTAEGVSEPVFRAGLANLKRERERALRVPALLVEAMQIARARGHRAWLEARGGNDYTRFQPALAELLRLSREWARCLSDPGAHPYDALLDTYEPGARVAEIRPLLGRLEKELRVLMSRLPDDTPTHVPTPEPTWSDAQRRGVYNAVLVAMGFEFQTGRLDTSIHPFTSTVGEQDVRITTRIRPGQFLAGLGAVLHEGGHALYVQGLPLALKGTGAGGPVSLGIHESQSRFWENRIGGSLPFFRWILRDPARPFAGELGSAEALFAERNRIRPSLIRVEADEVTYNLHVLVRFNLELALVEGGLAPADLEQAWNDAYETMLGVRPARATEGVLQDLHWSEGIFGYFPTYSLGNLYAASMGASMEAEIPELWALVEGGCFKPILEWLRERVHTRARLSDASTLLRDAVGARDHVEDLMGYLWRRHGALHGIHRPEAREAPR